MQKPRFTFTATIVHDLMTIEAARQTEQLLTHPLALTNRLRVRTHKSQ